MALPVSTNQSLFMILVHNKGQIYFPKPDNIFGSAYIILPLEDILKKETLNETGLYQYYELERTYWKALDTPEKRCDMKNTAFPTKCITNYLEKTIGCSMGLVESNPHVQMYLRMKFF